MPQLLQPDADIQVGGFDAPVWSFIDGATSDANESTAKAATEAICSLQDPAGSPDPDADHILRWAGGFSKTGSTVVVRLYQGTTLITEQDSSTTSTADQSYTLSAGERAAITDYADLRIAMACTSYGGKGATIRWSWGQLEVPDAPFEGSEFRTWDGGAWVPGKLKRWDGGQWAPAQVQRWTGSAWEDVP